MNNRILLVVMAFAGITCPQMSMSQPSRDVEGIAKYVYPGNKTAQPENFTYFPDGSAYMLLSEDGKRIVSYDIKSGKELDVIFDVAEARETKLERIDGFEISPNGAKLLVYNESQPIYRRSYTAKYYIYERRSKLLRPLSSKFGYQRAPLFSPDGRMVAFVASDNNIYLKKWDYNTEIAVTTDGVPNKIINGVPDWTYEEEFSTSISMDWASDNQTLCYIRYDESQVPMYSFPLYKGTCQPKNEYELYPGHFSYKYPVAGMPNSNVSVHSYDVETRKIKELTLPDRNIEYIPRIKYTNTPDRLIVATLNRDQNRVEFYCVNPKSMVAKSVYVEESKAWIEPITYEDFTLENDGFSVISSRSGYRHIYKYTYAGALAKQITNGDFDVTDYYGCDAQGNYYFQSAQPTPMDRCVSRTDRKGGSVLISKDSGTSSASFSPLMDYCVLSYSNVSTPPVYTVNTSSGKVLRTLEDNSTYHERYAGLPEKEFFVMESDGVKLNGYMVKPTGFDVTKKYPVIMYQYSGPGSQEVLNRWRMDWDYYFAIKGYIVMCVDGRGTGGRGREFMDVVYKRLGYYETVDQINAARYAASLPFVDKDRIGIFGWSYGGYETLMAISNADSPYSAAVAVAPVTDWRYYDTVYAERYMLTPQQNGPGYDASAPINRVDGVKCPLLLMSGTADDNVHFYNTLQYVSVLQSRGILCDMLVFPNMNHSINGCNARAVVYAKMLDFFNRNM